MAILYAECYKDICDFGLIRENNRKVMNRKWGGSMRKTFKYMITILAVIIFT